MSAKFLTKLLALTIYETIFLKLLQISILQIDLWLIIHLMYKDTEINRKIHDIDIFRNKRYLVFIYFETISKYIQL